MHKHSETALNTQKNDGTKSSFPIKVHAIPGKTPAICKFLVAQMWCKKEKCKCLKSSTCILLGTLWTTCFRTNLWKIWVGFIS